MSSEVARLRQQIAEEIRAMNRTKEFAAVARHATITHHLEKIGICVEQLKKQIGEKEAAAIFIEQMEQER